MKNCMYILLILSLSFYILGCRKKASVEQSSETISMEELTALSSQGQTPTKSKYLTAETPVLLESLPPQGPYKPTAVEIQTALKNAGYYTAAIDGKIGPLTKKAIEEFQKANGLESDGKVGPKTWAVLSKYLNPLPSEPVTDTKK